MAVEYDKLLEHASNNYEKYGSKGDINLEAGTSSISDNNLAQDVLVEYIKIESSTEQLSNDIGETKNCQFGSEKIETIKVEKNVKNENERTLQEDPLLEDNQTHVKLEVNRGRYALYHSKSRPHSCEICGKCFRRKANARMHQYVHSGKRPFPCDQCDKTFRSNYQLKAHKECHVSCEQCGNSFTGKRRLEQHVRRVHLVKVHICSYCGKTFGQRDVLMSHIRIHGDKLTCEVCKKLFGRSTTLAIHMRSHTGERPYSCNLCPGKFTSSRNLLRHMQAHTRKEKTEKC